jgi:NAD(P)H-dependent FMN reductase
LLNVLDHFGSSTFSFKPSAIVSYSAGQWGGTRAAIALRPVLSELGCLPVSAMIHLPQVQDVLDEEGVPIKDEENWQRYTDRCFSQLEWWATAAKAQKRIVDPTQRNAP